MPGQVIPGKGKTAVIYGKPIEVEKKPADQITHDDLRSLTDRVTMEIQKMSGQEYVDEYAQKIKEQLESQGRGLIPSGFPQVGTRKMT